MGAVAAIAGASSRRAATAEEISGNESSDEERVTNLDTSVILGQSEEIEFMASNSLVIQEPAFHDFETSHPSSPSEREQEPDNQLGPVAIDDKSAMSLYQSPQKLRHAHKHAVKAERRAQRNGVADAVASKQKLCHECARGADLLVRCTVDASQKWHMLCGRCWTKASGGVPDGDANHPHYRYGGLWKNRAATTQTPSFGVQYPHQPPTCHEQKS
jgi:hypothetical protein